MRPSEQIHWLKAAYAQEPDLASVCRDLDSLQSEVVALEQQLAMARQCRHDAERKVPDGLELLRMEVRAIAAHLKVPL